MIQGSLNYIWFNKSDSCLNVWTFERSNAFEWHFVQTKCIDVAGLNIALFKRLNPIEWRFV